MPIRKRVAATAAFLVACGAFAGDVSRTSAPGGGVMAAPPATQAPGDRSRRHPVPLPASIDVSGRVEGQGDATSGTITVRVGTAETSIAGTFSPQFHATVAGTRARDMVTIEIAASGLKFTSILGSYGKLVSLAGSDRVLTLDECDALRVSPFSTALQFFVSRHLGAPPLSDTQHEGAWRAVVGSDFGGISGSAGVGLGTATTLLGRFATGDLALPSGYAHGYALLQDQAAYRDYVNGTPGVLDGYVDDLDALGSAEMSDRDLKPWIAVLDRTKDAQAPLFGIGAEILQRTADGYRVHAQQSRRNPDFTAGLDAAGRLQLVPRNDWISYDTWLVCSTGQSTLRRTTLLGHSHRLQRRGGRSSLWMTVSEYRDTYSPECPDYQAQTFKTATFRIALDLAKPHAGGLAKRFRGTLGLPYVCLANPGGPGPTNYLQQCEYAPHRFGSGGAGVVTGLGQKVGPGMQPVVANGSDTFAWQASSSSIRVQYPDVSVRYWIVEPGSSAVTGLVFLAEAVDGQNTTTLAGHSAMINGNTTQGFAALPPAGSWKYASFEQYVEPYAFNEDTAYAMTRFVRTPNGHSVRQGRYPAYPEFDYDTPSSWSLFHGSLYDVRVLANPAGQYHDCDEAFADGATFCAPFTVRYFQPLARAGNRLYGIEDIYNNLTLGNEPPYQFERFSRPTYYERE